MSTNVFQVSAVSQNDPKANDGSALYCVVKEVKGATLRESDSFPIGTEVHLPTPPGQSGSGPTPNWFMIPTGAMEAVILTMEVFCPTNAKYPKTTITIKAADVVKWAEIPKEQRKNQIYAEGADGIFGYATSGRLGPIYTITAGVFDPKVSEHTVTV